MKTAEIINNVCSELGITKAELAKRMGMLPSSLYRKLSRESMTFEELQKCVDVLGVTIAFDLQYPDGNVQNSQVNHELLLEKMELLERELEVSKKAAEFHKKSLRDLRAELSSAIGYAEFGERHTSKAEQYLEKIHSVLSKMESTISYALGEELDNELSIEEPANPEMLKGKRVLLVEDNNMNREILREILIDHGLEVEEACDGNEAAVAVKEKEAGYYHFILMDIEMPDVENRVEARRMQRVMARFLSVCICGTDLCLRN